MRDGSVVEWFMLRGRHRVIVSGLSPTRINIPVAKGCDGVT